MIDLVLNVHFIKPFENNNNCRDWSNENSQFGEEHIQHFGKIYIWGGILLDQVIEHGTIYRWIWYLFECPTTSPDLSLLEFHLYGYSESPIYT